MHFLALSRLVLPICGLVLPVPFAHGQHSSRHAATHHKSIHTTTAQNTNKAAKQRADENTQAAQDNDSDDGPDAGQETSGHGNFLPGTQLPTSNTPDIKAGSAILMDAVSGQVLYEKNADQSRPMASTTKIMTALLLCERIPNEDMLITASKFAASTRESSLHLKAGEKVSAHDLLRAILMRSANDACVAAAEHVGGSVAGFADLMNARAQQLGCTHTHFVNPHGLQNKLHYTSARDLALIARQAIQEPRISEVTQLRKCRIKRSMDKFDVTMRNHSHKFLEKYPGADGIKTGWTIPAGHCFVGSATHNGWRLIAVVLKSPDFVQETGALLNYGFGRFEPRAIAKAGDPQAACAVTNGTTQTVPTTVKRTVQVVVPRNASLPPPVIQTHVTMRPQIAPVAFGTEVGTLEAQMDGKTICASPLIASANVPALVPAALLTKSGGFSKSLLFMASIFVALVVSLRYGKGITTSTKNARRRWRRLKKSVRGSYR